jgi:hypothetical protein
LGLDSDKRVSLGNRANKSFSFWLTTFIAINTILPVELTRCQESIFFASQLLSITPLRLSEKLLVTFHTLSLQCCKIFVRLVLFIEISFAIYAKFNLLLIMPRICQCIDNQGWHCASGCEDGRMLGSARGKHDEEITLAK